MDIGQNPQSLALAAKSGLGYWMFIHYPKPVESPTFFWAKLRFALPVWFLNNDHGRPNAAMLTIARLQDGVAAKHPLVPFLE